MSAKSLDQITEALKARSLQSSPQALTWVIILVHATAKDSISILACKGVGLVGVCVCVCVCVSWVNILFCMYYYYQFSSVQSLSRVQLFATPWTAACQASLSITNCCSLLKLMSTESVMPSNRLILFHLLLLLTSIFTTSKSFPMNPFFASGGQSFGVSASVLPMNIQD